MKTWVLIRGVFALAAVVFTGCSKDKGNDPVTFQVTITSTYPHNEHGAVHLNKSEAKAGEEIIATANPAPGCEFVKWTATGVAFDDETANPVTFTMPAGNVTIEAEFTVVLSGPTIYVAGSDSYSPCLWVDGVKQMLPTGSGYGAANAVFVSEGTVYVAGQDAFDPCVWINGVQHMLPAEGISDARSIFVSEGRVYVAGYSNEEDKRIACLWVDGERQTLPAPNSTAHCYAVIFDEGSIYAAGNYYDGTNTVPCLWIDGMRQDLQGVAADYACPLGVCVSGGKVFVAGYDGNTPAPLLWVDGVKQVLPKSENAYAAIARSVAVSDEKVCVVGEDWTDAGSQPCMWIGGLQYILPTTGEGGASSVSTHSGKIYVTGKDDGDHTACLWVHGVKQILESNGAAFANSIFIVAAQ